jgi:hypothetical protein
MLAALFLIHETTRKTQSNYGTNDSTIYSQKRVLRVVVICSTFPALSIINCAISRTTFVTLSNGWMQKKGEGNENLIHALFFARHKLLSTCSSFKELISSPPLSQPQF